MNVTTITVPWNGSNPDKAEIKGVAAHYRLQALFYSEGWVFKKTYATLTGDAEVLKLIAAAVNAQLAR